jgi:hypothetical protein
MGIEAAEGVDTIINGIKVQGVVGGISNRVGIDGLAGGHTQSRSTHKVGTACGTLQSIQG